MQTSLFLEEKARAGQFIREAQQRYQRLLASVTDYVYSVTIHDGLPVATTHGPGCEAVTGYASREFDSDPFLWYHMIHKEDRPAVTAQADRVLRGDTPPPLEHRILRKDGRLRWIKNTPVPHKDHQGQLIGYDGLVADITERKQAELALRQSQERLALVIQGSSDGIWDWDTVTNEVYFSTRWKGMLGYEDSEVAHHFSSWDRLLHPDDRARALACLRAYLAGHTQTFELEHRLRHKDGSYRWILSRGVALRDAYGNAVRMAGSHVDVTAQKEAQERLQRAYAELSRNEAALKTALQELQAANAELKATQLQLIQAAKLESVGTLAAGVAHEVKNPLQTVLMGLDYLSNNPVGGNGNTHLVLDDMRDAVTHANSIVRELLQLSAPRHFDLKPENLNHVVDRSLRLIHSEVVASQITVVRNLDPALPPVRLDSAKMQQVLINLFINALQAMSQGGVLTVATRRRRFGEDLKLSGPAFSHFAPGDPVVVAEVQDTGPGIPEAHLTRIFDPFFTTKPTGVGTGLGLSVAKKIMDFHGGTIDIRNHPPTGVLVSLVLKAEPNSQD